MNCTIRVRASREHLARYQELLRQDWTRQTVDDVLSLLRDLISGGLDPTVFAWQDVLGLNDGRKSARDFNEAILDRIRDLSAVLREPAIPPMPDSFSSPHRPSRLTAQAEQAWSYLVLQAMAKVEGASGLFADVQSLLFLTSAHFLLRPLQQHNQTAEHDCLVCAMYVHTVLVWKTMPAHMLHLQSVLMDHLGNVERQLELLEMSFLLTPPDDHAYLTRATAYWSALMELARYETARTFLFSLMRHAPDSCQEEIRDMLTETFSEPSKSSA
jgi:hypothetical protein